MALIECPTQESLPAQRRETSICGINIDDIGIHVDVISGINKTSFNPADYSSLSIKKEKSYLRSFRPFRLALFTVMSYLLFA